MKIQPMEIEQEIYRDLVIDCSDQNTVTIHQGLEYSVTIERDKIQELIGVLKHEVTE